MVQNAAACDEIEMTTERRKFEDVGLAVFNIVQTERVGAVFCIAEAGEAEIDCEYARARIAPGHHDGLLAGAATGDQHVEAVRSSDRAITCVRKIDAQSRIDGVRDFIRSALHPARVGAFLVLVLHQKRNIIFNRG